MARASVLRAVPCFLVIVALCTTWGLAQAPSFFTCPDGRPIPIEWQCDGVNDCRDESASDEQSCESVVGECSSTQFRCNDSSKCIPAMWVCDGDIDCPDLSDEKRCAHQICLRSQSQCKNDLCVPTSFLCDGDDDCQDNSDEMNCTALGSCGEHQYQCDNGLCIPSNWECDGEPDCEDSSDEMSCGGISYRCWYGMFNCSSGGCINVNLVCDGSVDCPNDDSDEQDCGTSTCQSDEFQCPDARVGCIPLGWMCDGEDDCGDWSDELDCHGRCVAESQYSCITGGCVEQYQRCDENEDCLDGSDEFLCPPSAPIVCNENQFPCWDGKQCIGAEFICDKQSQCNDGSDEDSWLCDSASQGVDECLDNNGDCTDVCVNTPYSHFCTCRQGHYLDPNDRHVCMDINECELPCTCSQACNNLHGDYKCSCVEGYEPTTMSGHGGCKATGPRPYLLFANRVDIRRVNLDGSQPRLCIRQRHNTIPLDFHYSLGYIFWADLAVDTIMRATMDCTEETTIIDSGLKGPGGLAVDWVGNHLYWTDAEAGRIEVSNLDGGNRRVLFGTDLDRPRAIVVDPSESLLFWTDWGANARIERANMDGSNRMVVQGRHLIWPNALTIDYPTKTLYWGDAKHHAFESSSYDGSNRRAVILENAGHPFAVSMFEDQIYWSDWETKSIRTNQKCGGLNVTEIYPNLYQPMDVHVVHPVRQPLRAGGNPCHDNNGGCEFLCLLSNTTSEGFSCVCPTGVRVAEDGRTCQRLDEFILFARRKDIQRVSLDVEDLISVVLPLENLTGATAVDWDSSTDLIYWSDVVEKAIYVATTVGTDKRTLLSDNLYSPTGLAIDWITDSLYWIDAESKRIEVAHLNGTHRGIVVYNNLDKPRAIVVHPTAGVMFWSDWGEEPKIERAALDGSRRVAIVTTNLTYPNGLALDYEREKIYWIDGARDVIEYSNFDGSDRHVLLSDGLKHPFGLTLHENYVYWTDWVTKSVQRASKFDGSDRSTIVANLENPMDIRVFHRNREEPESHPCESNGGCSHLCLSRPNKRKPKELEASCACPVGHTLLNDQRTCNPDIDAYLVFPTTSDIHQISLDTSYIADVVLPVHHVASTTSVDVDIQGQDVYWTNALESKIYKTPIEGGPITEVIGTGLITPESLAVDWIGQNLYWVDRGTRWVEVAKLDGSSRRVLFSTDLVSPNSIAIDLQSHTMFWTDMGDFRFEIPAKIQKASMDGSGRVTIVTQSIMFPRSITVDNPVGIGGRIYWSDSFHGTIDSANLDGGDRKNLLAGLTAPYGLAILDDAIYWTDFTDNSIYRATKSDGSNQRVFSDNVEGLTAIKVIKTTDLEDKASFDHPCITDRGCTDLCLPSHSIRQYTCACPTGLKVNSDEKTCPPVPEMYLLFALDSTVRRISLDTEETSDVILVSDLGNVIFLDYLLTSPTEGTIFWGDVLKDSIMASNLDGTDVRTVVTDLRFPEGIAVDWVAGNIYWIDTGRHRNYLGVTTIEGEHRRLLFKGLDEPRDIAIHPHFGMLFWSDWSRTKPVIEACAMDGTNRRVVVSTGLIWPNGLTIDYATDLIYWHDARMHRMERMTINGLNRQLIFDNSESNIVHPFGLAVHSGFLFWSEWETGSIFRAKTDGTNQMKISIEYRDPKGLEFVSTDRPGELSPYWLPGPCTHNNGGCPYLCLTINNTYRRCGCPDSLGPNVCNDSVGRPTTAPTTPPVPVVTTKPPTEEPPTKNSTTSETITPSIVDTPPVDESPSVSVITSPTTESIGTDPTGTESPNRGHDNPPTSQSKELGKEILIPLILVSVVLLIILIVIITVSIIYLKMQHGKQERQHASLQVLRFQFSNPGFPATLNRLNSQNSLKPLQKKDNSGSKRISKVKNSNRNSSTSHHDPNIFVEEPEVFEIPQPTRKRRMPTPPNSPLVKTFDTFETVPFRAGEKEPSPPPRPPKGERVLRRMRKLPDMQSDEGDATGRQSSSCGSSLGSSIDIKVNIEDPSQDGEQTPTSGRQSSSSLGSSIDVKVEIEDPSSTDVEHTSTPGKLSLEMTTDESTV